MENYTLIRSARRTLALEVTREGKVLVRAPKRVTQAQIEDFVRAHGDWLERALVRQQARLDAHPEPDAEKRRQLILRAQQELPARVNAYAEKMDLRPTGISITVARTRFGSCSAKNRLCFSLYLMDYPEQAIDYVVVHELAHIVHKNHGPRFWQLVESVLPDYKARRALLR